MSAAPQTAAPSGRRKSIGNRSLAIVDVAKPPAALGHEAQNTPSPEGANEMRRLPIGWRWARLSEVCSRVQDGTHFSPKQQTPTGDFKYITAKNIKHWGLDLSELTYVPAHVHHEIYKRCNVEKGDVLYIKDGVTTGIATVNTLDEEFSLLSSVALLKPRRDILDSQFLRYYLNSPEGFRNMTGQMTGTAIKRLILQKIKAAVVPIAPLPAQRRIVAEIEKQFTRLEAGVAALRRVQANLKRYRAAVLKAACEGKLVPTEAELTRVGRVPPRGVRPSAKNATSGDAAYNNAGYESGEQLLQRILAERRKNWTGRGKYKEPAAPDTANLPPLPDGWTWASVEQLGDVETGFTPPKGNAAFFGGDIPFFKPTDLDAGYYVREFRDSLTEAGAEHGRILPARSILVTCIGATIGKTGLARVRCATNQQINALTVPVALISPEFLFWLFSSPFGQCQVKENASATTLPILNKSKFEALAIPLPPLAEQTRIVAEVERRLSVVEELETVVSANLQRATRLRQSILQKAFRGELLTADDTDAADKKRNTSAQSA